MIRSIRHLLGSILKVEGENFSTIFYQFLLKEGRLNIILRLLEKAADVVEGNGNSGPGASGDIEVALMVHEMVGKYCL